MKRWLMVFIGMTAVAAIGVHAQTAAPVAVSNPDLQKQIALLNSLLTQVAEFLSHLSLGAVTAHGIEWLKKQPITGAMWHAASDRGQVVMAGGAALLGSLGITASFYHAPDMPAGTFGIAIAGLTTAGIGHHVWSWAQSWALQQGWYAKVIQSASNLQTQTQQLVATLSKSNAA